MTSIAVVPGSFDPITLGHLDIVRRAAKIFDEVHVLVVHNPDKNSLLSADVRAELVANAVTTQAAEIASRVTVRTWSEGLLVDYCKQVAATALVKGVRGANDLAYETPMVLMNRSLADIETVFVLPDPAFSMVSSSLVRQVHALGGDVSEFVPANVADYLRAQQNG